eukprot:s3287_g5.t1
MATAQHGWRLTASRTATASRQKAATPASQKTASQAAAATHHQKAAATPASQKTAAHTATATHHQKAAATPASQKTTAAQAASATPASQKTAAQAACQETAAAAQRAQQTATPGTQKIAMLHGMQKTTTTAQSIQMLLLWHPEDRHAAWHAEDDHDCSVDSDAASDTADLHEDCHSGHLAAADSEGTADCDSGHLAAGTADCDSGHLADADSEGTADCDSVHHEDCDGTANPADGIDAARDAAAGGHPVVWPSGMVGSLRGVVERAVVVVERRLFLVGAGPLEVLLHAPLFGAADLSTGAAAELLRLPGPVALLFDGGAADADAGCQSRDTSDSSASSIPARDQTGCDLSWVNCKSHS